MSAPKEHAATVRAARAADAERIAVLSGQLGYPATSTEVRARLQRLEGDDEHAALVAVAPDGELVAWLHVHLVHLLELDTQAEISGLVVDDAWRRRGVGALLMRHAEQWAREQGCKTIRLRSNVIRERAHRFYDRLGYELQKTQKVFRKTL
jgi:GNAT superfamily N-acetyltransferase